MSKAGANRLNEIRKSKSPELELYEIAATLGVSEPTVRRWDNGREIPTKYLGLLTALLDCTADHLLGLDREPATTGKAA